MSSWECLIRLAILSAMVCASALVLEPLVIRWAARLGVVDMPDSRRVHEKRVPRAGGMIFFPCLVLGCVAVLLWWPVFWRDRYLGLLTALWLITIVGIWDDVRGMRASLKLLFQAAAGAVLFFSGYRLEHVSVPFTNAIVQLGFFDLIVTVVGVAAIINAVNMLDGLDGLAAGSVFIMCGFLLINKAAQGAVAAGAILALMMGATLGFLRYNFHPAKVFMGDTGSMGLGLVLAAETLDAVSQGAALATILLPLVILGIPLLDMVRTMVTRFRIARNIFEADKNHLHHRLLSLGLSHREAVLFIYGLNVYMGIMAVLYRHVAPAFRGLYLLALATFLILASYLIGVGHRKNTHGAAGSSG